MESAITEPTERSTPSLPMASAMPSATMMTGATWTAWVRKFSVDRKSGVNAMLARMRTATPTYTPYS